MLKVSDSTRKRPAGSHGLTEAQPACAAVHTSFDGSSPCLFHLRAGEGWGRG